MNDINMDEVVVINKDHIEKLKGMFLEQLDLTVQQNKELFYSIGFEEERQGISDTMDNIKETSVTSLNSILDVFLLKYQGEELTLDKVSEMELTFKNHLLKAVHSQNVLSRIQVREINVHGVLEGIQTDIMSKIQILADLTEKEEVSNTEVLYEKLKILVTDLENRVEKVRRAIDPILDEEFITKSMQLMNAKEQVYDEESLNYIKTKGETISDVALNAVLTKTDNTVISIINNIIEQCIKKEPKYNN